MKMLVFLALIWNLNSAQANVVGNGAQNFNTITSGLDFVTVQSSETLKPGIVNFGLFFNYAINSLPYFDDVVQGRVNFTDTLLGADFNIGLGVLKDLEVGLSFPYIVAQSVAASQVFHGEFSRVGNTEVRASSKYRIFGQDDGGLAVIGSVDFNRTVNNPYVGTGGGPAYNLEIAYDRMLNPKMAWAINIGHRWMMPGVQITGSPIVPLKNQFIFSTAINYLISSANTKLVSEIFGSVPVSGGSSFETRTNTSLEIIAGVKHALNDNFAIHGGLGTGLTKGVSSPDWRFYAGMNYTFGPLWKPAPIERLKDRFILKNIVFEYDSDQMIGNYREVLAEIVDHIKALPSYKIINIEGHTDSIGNEEYNQKLSQKRADAIRNFLIKEFGIKPNKLKAEGLGESRPIADNGNFQGRQENRRVEFQIVQ
jgi:outer membrane protein OmpA-like peptidoglycan-associated protein